MKRKDTAQVHLVFFQVFFKKKKLQVCTGVYKAILIKQIEKRILNFLSQNDHLNMRHPAVQNAWTNFDTFRFFKCT